MQIYNNTSMYGKVSLRKFETSLVRINWQNLIGLF